MTVSLLIILITSASVDQFTEAFTDNEKYLILAAIIAGMLLFQWQDISGHYLIQRYAC